MEMIIKKFCIKRLKRGHKKQQRIYLQYNGKSLRHIYKLILGTRLAEAYNIIKNLRKNKYRKWGRATKKTRRIEK